MSLAWPIAYNYHSETAVHPTNSSLPSPWLGGIDLSGLPGPSIGEKIAQATHALGADVLSPSAQSFQSPVPDPSSEGYVPFTSNEMVKEAHRLGLDVKVWTVCGLSLFRSQDLLTSRALLAGEQAEYRRAVSVLGRGRNHHRL